MMTVAEDGLWGSVPLKSTPSCDRFLWLRPQDQEKADAPITDRANSPVGASRFPRLVGDSLKLGISIASLSRPSVARDPQLFKPPKKIVTPIPSVVKTITTSINSIGSPNAQHNEKIGAHSSNSDKIGVSIAQTSIPAIQPIEKIVLATPIVEVDAILVESVPLVPAASKTFDDPTILPITKISNVPIVKGLTVNLDASYLIGLIIDDQVFCKSKTHTRKQASSMNESLFESLLDSEMEF
ncbi:hypothetical protein ACH5RR_032190 [Cinchona calisaya]|uniref:Uncharacterized protein n=1 Tax=Cinchona calisaya TaxID=153742 RepID=A0ABD2YMN6_9GENT